MSELERGDWRIGCAGDCRRCYFFGGCPYEVDEFDDDEEDGENWQDLDDENDDFWEDEEKAGEG